MRYLHVRMTDALYNQQEVTKTMFTETSRPCCQVEVPFAFPIKFRFGKLPRYQAALEQIKHANKWPWDPVICVEYTDDAKVFALTHWPEVLATQDTWADFIIPVLIIPSTHPLNNYAHALIGAVTLADISEDYLLRKIMASH